MATGLLVDLDHLEVFFAYSTIGAAPIFGNIFPARAGRNALVGQAQSLVILELTHHALPFLHVIHHRLQIKSARRSEP